MRFYTIEFNGQECVAVENLDNKLVTLDSIGIKVSDMNELVKRFDELESEIIKNIQYGLTPDNYKILAPIPVPLQDIICLGVNYREHIEETAEVVDFTKKQDAVYFSKRVNRCNDPDGTIPVYDFVDSLDYEVELGVILKKDAFQVTAEEASEYIFGYTIINDVSARNIQLKHLQWYRGKSLDGYTPMGPCIVTSDEIDEPHNLSIECFVNNEKRQRSNTSCMITTVEDAISELSQGMTLKAGTIIATGTPGGVGMGFNPPKFLQQGDIVKCRIEKLGELVNRVGMIKF
ncbi:2-keto-4-pentenoate hydratase/2-oxohepta-3-ene-1,7-dioic acid hydratase (catechol pathway) [Pseudobutyrivibrio sp. ACV-2]|uniref:fumarylacetoacetate hydrolase family protein n=1 Tax=Pseudobutyrivibrio sp. ACV-2 TaxID=1520801 RepID=UPI00089754B5|nr:fumarylacetoacetate hydrolase family protein [Pseudobutyrivibrio sp. ACV-2]SEB05686.1 2-keto-4-pentenoate hydratase/2-oxohepta-3-ene-1,7-dioic acid hydratase (catechol pathway) [Pseudobutyrivibrio sp. ACV-2]